MRERKQIIFCLHSYEGYIFNTVEVYTYAYVERGRYLDRESSSVREKTDRDIVEGKYEQSTTIYMCEMIQWILLFCILK